MGQKLQKNIFGNMFWQNSEKLMFVELKITPKAIVHTLKQINNTKNGFATEISY